MIYENVLVKEALSQISTHYPKTPIKLQSSYDSSSDDAVELCQTLEYDSKKFHNHYTVSEEEKIK